MTDDIESAEAFAERLADEHMYVSATGDYVYARADATDIITARDSAIRSWRDAEWTAAMGIALGIDSRLKVPLYPEEELCRNLFAAIRAAALEEAADSLRDIRVLNLRAGWTSTIDAAESHIRALATKGSSK